MIKVNSPNLPQNSTPSSHDKPSFSRFGDDLGEVILSYLSIRDKIRFECLSKQTQTLIYNKQKSIIISNNYMNYINNSSVNQLLYKSRDYKHLYHINERQFETLLSKFWSIEDLVIDNYCIIDGNILRLIADNCLNLRQFTCTSIKCLNIRDEDLDYFGQKMSKTLQSIQFDCLQDIQLNRLLHLMKNSINRVSIENNNFCLRNDFVFLDIEKLCDVSSKKVTTDGCSPKMLPKLRSIQITCYSVEDIQRLADYYSKDLTEIRIRFMSNYLMGNVMNSCLKQLSRFSNIQSLTLLMYNYQKGLISPINEGLLLIGRNCTQLKHFVCEMTKNLISGQLFDVFGSGFSSLRTCKVSTTYEEDDSYGTVDGLKNSKQLKHLTLYLKYLSDKHFVNIQTVLPNLRSFKVNTTNGYMTDRTVLSLSKLRQLSSVEISGSSPSLAKITDHSVAELVANCPHIQNVSLFCRTSVGRQTVDQFIETAKRYPKNSYKYFYEFHNDFNESYEDLRPEFDPLSYESYPENLSIYQI